MDTSEKSQFPKALLFSILLHSIILAWLYFRMPNKYTKLYDQSSVVNIETKRVTESLNLDIVNKSSQEKSINKSYSISKKKVFLDKKKLVKKEGVQKIKQKDRVQVKKIDTKQLKSNLRDPILKNSIVKSKNIRTENYQVKKQIDKSSVESISTQNHSFSVTEELQIKRIISDHWTPPIEFGYIKGIHLKVHIKLDKTGEIISSNVQSIKCPIGTEDICTSLRNSVLRSIRKVNIVKGLSLDRYNIWKEFILSFDSDCFN